jgi:hypothetical protein
MYLYRTKKTTQFQESTFDYPYKIGRTDIHFNR